MAQVGRPKLNDSKKHIVACRLNDVELEKLENFCKAKQITKGQVLKDGINIILHNMEGK